VLSARDGSSQEDADVNEALRLVTAQGDFHRRREAKSDGPGSGTPGGVSVSPIGLVLALPLFFSFSSGSSAGFSGSG